MANFSALEQMTNMANMMEKFIESQNENSVLRYSEMIGKKVYWEEIQENEDGQQTVTESGIVKSVVQKNNEIILELEDGKTVLGKLITKVEMPTAEKQ
jgi:flagellar basal-body rod modification protein FlgD